VQLLSAQTRNLKSASKKCCRDRCSWHPGIRRDEEHTLEKLIARLPDKYREALVLREIEDMRYREIAAVTNLPMGTVMSRLARARSALKERWLLQANGEPHAVP
jgi:DNA-directed RNA polymerase specialized sigma24 family protein